MKIPITMCHGVSDKGDKPLTLDRYKTYFAIARELGFESIDYNQLAAWRDDDTPLPDRPIMFDIDHPVISLRYGLLDLMSEHGFRANLFVNTLPMEELYAAPIGPAEERDFMTWEEIGDLMEAGWHIGAHTHTHPNLSKLSTQDPTGERIREEFEKNDGLLRKHLGVEPRDLAFTGTSWSSTAEAEAMKRYRFGRLWIVGAEYQADGEPMRYADLVNVPGDDEADGGPPAAARYITKETPAYRLPSMELAALIHEPDAFRQYLEHSFP